MGVCEVVYAEDGLHSPWLAVSAGYRRASWWWGIGMITLLEGKPGEKKCALWKALSKVLP